jgi:hypothetical protein
MTNSGHVPSRVTFCARRWPIEQDGVRSALREQGFDVRDYHGGPLDVREAGILWLQGNPRWFPSVCGQLSALPCHERPFSVVWHHEPLPPPQAAGLPQPRLLAHEVVKRLIRRHTVNDVHGNARWLLWLHERGIPDLLAVSTRGRQEFLAERGISALWAPLGFWPGLGADLGLERDIPVLFLGDARLPRRRRVLRSLRRRGVPVQVAGSWSDPAFWGAARTRLLNRVKIMLNLNRNPGDLPGLRFILGMANGALVASEPVYRPEPYVPGQHFISADAEALPRVIADCLARVEEFRPIVLAGRRLVTEDVTVSRSIARIAAAIRGGPP